MTDRYSLGIVGYPLAHSHSPVIHHAALRAAGLEGEYLRYPIPAGPEGLASLPTLLGRVRSGEVQGLNVTVPHKRAVLPHLDRLTPAAQAIGAVNTISMEGEELVGDNTDAPGFAADLDRFLTQAGISGQRALVLGAGGSARAVVYALLMRGWRLAIAARRLEQALEIMASFQSAPGITETRITPLPLDPRELRFRPCSLLVNTTPVGMHPDVDRCPWPDGTPFPEGAAVYDLVYNPEETLLVRTARAAGHPADTGLGMLVEQAALAFERWTGHAAPRQAMRRAAETN